MTKRWLLPQLGLVVLFLGACSSKAGDAPADGSVPPAPTPADDDPAPGPGAEEPGEPGEPASAETLTNAECQAKGGQVIGDIGNGAIHQPDYRCENGEPPIAKIVPGPDEPIAAEGSVCCGT